MNLNLCVQIFFVFTRHSPRILTDKCKGLMGTKLFTSSTHLKDISKSCKKTNTHPNHWEYDIEDRGNELHCFEMHVDSSQYYPFKNSSNTKD